MDKHIKDFINHLYEVGIVNQQSVGDILLIYNKYKIMSNSENNSVNSLTSKTPKHDLNHSTKDAMQNILFEFLNKQDQTSLQNISYNIVGKYTETNFLDKAKSAKKHFIYYMRFHTQKIKYYFCKWRQNIKKKWKVIEKPKGTTEFMKEQDSLKSCTFKPEINKFSKSLTKLRSGISHKIDPFSRLYSDHIKIKTKRAIKKEQMDKKESDLLRNGPLITNPNHSMYTQNDYCSKSFLDRQEEYEQVKSKNREKILKETEEVDNMIFTFTPSVNTSFRNNIANFPAHYRLYR